MNVPFESLASPALAMLPACTGWTAGIAALLALALAALFDLRRRAGEPAPPFEAIFEGASEAMVLMDGQLQILRANEAACALLGQSLRKLAHTPFARWVRAADGAAPPDWLRALETERTLDFEAGVETPAGAPAQVLDVRLTWIEHRGGPFIFAVLHDLTGHRQRSEAFQRFHKQLVDNLPIEVVVLSAHGEYLYLNPRTVPDADLRGWLKEKTDVEFAQRFGLHPEVALRRRAFRKRAVTKGEPVRFDETLTYPDGRTRHFVRSYAPVRNADGGIYAVIGYGVEVTELRAQEAEAHAARSEAEQAIRLRESFLDNISHEFRTPLTGILGASQILDSEVDPALREFVDIITRNGHRLMNTLNGMLDLVHLQSESLQMRPRLLNLVDATHRTVEKLQPAAGEKNLFLRLNAPRSEIFVRLDEGSLIRVLENLIGNAVKFTESGGVLVELDQDDARARFRVIDTGVGIRNDFLPHLFDDFNQESLGTGRSYEGSGIGLSITRRLIDMMQGSISVDSEKGEGSVFTVSFPLAFPARNGEEAPRALVVEDGMEAQQLARYLLEPPFQVDAAADLAAAVRFARQTRYDVVLLDLEVEPGTRPSREALLQLHGLPGYERVPVVAMDPTMLPGNEQAFREAGFDGYVAKPLNRPTLLEVLSSAMQAPDAKPPGAAG